MEVYKYTFQHKNSFLDKELRYSKNTCDYTSIIRKFMEITSFFFFLVAVSMWSLVYLNPSIDVPGCS